MSDAGKAITNSRQRAAAWRPASSSQREFQHDSLFDIGRVAGNDSEMQRDRTKLAALGTYEASVFRQAWAEISPASFSRSIAFAAVSFLLQWWAGFRPLHDTLTMVGLSLGSGFLVFLCELGLRLLRAPAKIMQEADDKLQKLEAEKKARKAFIVTPKKFSPAYDLTICSGGFDAYTMQDTIHEATLGVNPAVVNVRCHNLTATPIILEEIKLLDADTGEVIVRQDAKAQRIDANSSWEIDIPFGSAAAPYRRPPPWPGQVRVETASREEFLSVPFNFNSLV